MAKEYELESSDHLKFAVMATDIILFTLKNNDLYVRLIAVDRPPYFPKGSKGFPGGLIAPKETAQEAVMRHLKEKAAITSKQIYCEQLYTFDAVNRDPRGRVVAVSYIALVPWSKLTEAEKEDKENTWWAKTTEVKGLAYDHDQMLQVGLKRLRSKIAYTTLISKILPKEFTLGELEKAYSVILGTSLDKRNFRKKIIKLGILKELPEMRSGKAFRPAKLFQFKQSQPVEIEVL